MTPRIVIRAGFGRLRPAGPRAALLARHLLLCAGVALLGYCAFVLADGWWFQRREGRWLDRFADSGAPLERALDKVHERGVLGRMDVPRIGMTTVIVENARPRSLMRSAGHVAGTALPGFDGNVAIAGHRDTHFRPLRHVLVGDRVTITTPYGQFGYVVRETRVVDPTDVEVLASADEPVLTLITCFPFDYIGPAPRRLIVQAREVARRFFPES